MKGKKTKRDDELEDTVLEDRSSIFDENEDQSPELDEEIDIVNIEDEDAPTNLSEDDSEGSGPYTMGDIKYDGDDSDDDNQPVAEATKPSEDDEDVVWVDDEVSLEDKDPYLDMEDFDTDNPGREDYD
ncbi:MAG: hypothetical protein ACMG6E_08850 [Candidatus Roizmanbacteria bacterium]